ncbi:hypothetical protein BU16DRAFT_601429 [Lophium mytilinum]|uniref:Uncharacterized protein n=1 Tax=Lophium mytilinum TaxID=390894 RepID=A0A6A6R6F4_9PEZI|nr:hypothetical protein BU16DRAFT_601429 [Lophium mytilinum]
MSSSNTSASPTSPFAATSNAGTARRSGAGQRRTSSSGYSVGSSGVPRMSSSDNPDTSTEVQGASSDAQDKNRPNLGKHQVDDDTDENLDRHPKKKAKSAHTGGPISLGDKYGDKDGDSSMEDVVPEKKGGSLLQRLNASKRTTAKYSKKAASDTKAVARPAVQPKKDLPVEEDSEMEYVPEKEDEDHDAPHLAVPGPPRQKAAAKGANKRKGRGPRGYVRTPFAMPREDGGPKDVSTWMAHFPKGRLTEAIKSRGFWDEIEVRSPNPTCKQLAEALLTWDIAMLKGEIREEILLHGADHVHDGRKDEKSLGEMLSELPPDEEPEQEEEEEEQEQEEENESSDEPMPEPFEGPDDEEVEPPMPSSEAQVQRNQASATNRATRSRPIPRMPLKIYPMRTVVKQVKTVVNGRIYEINTMRSGHHEVKTVANGRKYTTDFQNWETERIVCPEVWMANEFSNLIALSERMEKRKAAANAGKSKQSSQRKPRDWSKFRGYRCMTAPCWLKLSAKELLDAADKRLHKSRLEKLSHEELPYVLAKQELELRRTLADRKPTPDRIKNVELAQRDYDEAIEAREKSQADPLGSVYDWRQGMPAPTEDLNEGLEDDMLAAFGANTELEQKGSPGPLFEDPEEEL